MVGRSDTLVLSASITTDRAGAPLARAERCWKRAESVYADWLCVVWVLRITVCDTERLWVQVGFRLFENQNRGTRWNAWSLLFLALLTIIVQTHWTNNVWETFKTSYDAGLQMICLPVLLNPNFPSWTVIFLCLVCSDKFSMIIMNVLPGQSPLFILKDL